jgi:pimeloyl-ACP methyl ester carboxylesterase
MSTADVNGVEIYYEDTGGEGPAVVFSHGLFMDADMFESQVQHLYDEFRCISWDERAHGRTKDQGSFTYWDSADDLLGLLDRLDVANAFLVGLSQGGFIGLRAAIRAPERVTGLVFIDSQAGPEPPEVLPGYEAMLEQWKESGPTEPLLAAVAAVILGEGTDWEPWLVKWRAMETDDVVRSFEALAGREDMHDRLREIGCPALVIHGEDDAAIGMHLAEALCEGLPGCEGIVRVAGAGHSSNLASRGS